MNLGDNPDIYIVYIPRTWKAGVCVQITIHSGFMYGTVCYMSPVPYTIISNKRKKKGMDSCSDVYDKNKSPGKHGRVCN